MPRAANVSAAPLAIRAREAERQAALAATLAELYPVPASIVFEIGCGHGHFLTAYAAAHPKELCLGVDLVKKRIERAQRKQRRMASANLAFLHADAGQLLAALPSHVTLVGVFVLFPDPWPKTRHHARRVLQRELLDALAQRSKAGAWLALRTDDPGHLEWARKQLELHPAWKPSPAHAWPFEHPTYFQEIKGPHQSLMAVRRQASAAR